jgi:hypothetical protein
MNNIPSPKICRRIRQLYAMLGSPNPNEAANAFDKLLKLLAKQNPPLSWKDIPSIVAAAKADDATAAPSASPPPPDPRDAAGPIHPVDDPAFTPAGTTHGMLEKYVVLDEHEYVAVALWIIHTHVYERFMVTPRLLLRSPVPNCGKTTLLDVISRLAARPARHDNITAAAIYHIINKERRVLLLDEFDNQDATAKGALRAVLNAGHRRGGKVTRVIRGRPAEFEVFCPMAVAAIGSSSLWPALLSRSIVIEMQRHDEARTLRRFNLADEEGMHDLDIIYSYIRQWQARAKINLDPDMPMGGRHADNWRPLIAIADACNAEWGARAREAAIALTRGGHDEDAAVTLLNHIRIVFDARGLDRLPSKALVAALIELDEADGMWREWRGRKLTQNGLAVLLKPFGIHPRPTWAPRRTSNSRPFRGYWREDFTRAWRKYCDEGATPPRSSLRLVGKA